MEFDSSVGPETRDAGELGAVETMSEDLRPDDVDLKLAKVGIEGCR